MPLNTNQIIRGRYRTLHALGRGGFGQVWLAEDINLSNRWVAIKENLNHSPQGNDDFKREAKLLASLNHPNLPNVIEWIEDTNSQLFVMAYIDGKTLEELLSAQRGALPETDVLRWIDQVMGAVTYLHTQAPPILHRDIKPANIRVTAQGNAILVDFGIAKQLIGGGPSNSARLVTPGYAPLEQWDGSGTTERTDVYGLGATLYYALTGIVPVEAPLRAAGTPLYPVNSLNPSISKRSSAIINKAMSMAAAERFETVDEMRRALQGKGLWGIPNWLKITAMLVSVMSVVICIMATIVWGLTSGSSSDPTITPTLPSINQPTSLSTGTAAPTRATTATATTAPITPTQFGRVTSTTAPTATPTSTPTPQPPTQPPPPPTASPTPRAPTPSTQPLQPSPTSPCVPKPGEKTC